jgi:hypothetical protein
MTNGKWKMENEIDHRLFASLRISTVRKYEILPTHPGDQAYKSFDTRFESFANEWPSSHRAEPYGPQTTVVNILCKDRARSPDNPRR